MTNTPEQTLRDLLALGEALPYGDLQGRAVWMETTHPSPIFEAVPLTLTHQELERLLQFFAASKNALPAIRDALTRLAAYEEAVGEYLAAREASRKAAVEDRLTGDLLIAEQAAEARLRALQEK